MLAPEANRVVGVGGIGGEGAAVAEGVIGRGGAHLGEGRLTGQVERDGLGEAALGVKGVGRVAASAQGREAAPRQPRRPKPAEGRQGVYRNSLRFGL